MRAAKASPRRARQAKPKSYTFTGCWTCRSRKVKCDERQTNGCGVCERAALPCAGYGVNLCWVTGKKSELQGLRRRNIKPIQPFAPSIPDGEINRMLVALDEIPMPEKTVTMGPFGVFQTETDEYLNEPSPSQETWSSLSSSDSDNDIVDCAEPVPSVYQMSEAASSTSLIPSQQVLDQEFLSFQDIELSIHQDLLLSPHLELSMPLFQDPETSMLMYHYMNHVAELLQPVLHPGNPWRTTYFPFALQGCPDLFLAQGATPPLGVSIALFHSILSSAAFHLRNLKRGSKRFHRLGLQHRARALHALNTSLTHPSDTQLYTVYLTAMLSLVTIDTITGEDSDFRIHLRGCRQLKRPVADSRSTDDSSRQVTSICHFLTLLARTTSLEPEPPSDSVNQPSFETRCFDSDDRGVEYMYGITPTLGNLLQRTCQLAECLSLYQGREAPGFVFQARESLKDDLRRWSIESEKFHLFGSEEAAMLEIARCQARAFHSAVLIFYWRTVEPDYQSEMQTEVCSVWVNLTTAEDLKDLYMGGEKRLAPMSWPAFIAACEASHRAPWVEWWTRVQDYWLGNFQRQWMVVQELWDIMDKDECVLNWREALKRSGKSVLPI